MDELIPRQQIASRLRQAREIAGLSQGQVARQTNMHRPTVSEIEAGRRRVVAEELSVFADLYGVSVSWLMTGNSRSDNNQEIEMAARKIEQLKPEDRERVMVFIRSLGSSEDNS